MHSMTVTGTQWDTLGQLLFLSLCLAASADAEKSLGHWDRDSPIGAVLSHWPVLVCLVACFGVWIDESRTELSHWNCLSDQRMRTR